MIWEAVRERLNNRLFDWTMALSMLGLSLELFIWKDVLEMSAWHYITDFLPSSVIRWILLIHGVGMVVALLINGRSKLWGPRCRAAGSFVGFILCLEIAVALGYFAHVNGAPPSPGIPFYFFWALGELWALYRAVTGRGNT